MNGYDSSGIFERSPSVEPFRESEHLRPDPEADKDDSLIDVEDVKSDSPPLLQKEDESENETVKKYNPLDVANLTSKDPPKSSPLRKKLLPSTSDSCSFGRVPKPWRPGGVYYSGDVDYSVPITTAYLKHMKNVAYQERLDGENKVSP